MECQRARDVKITLRLVKRIGIAENINELGLSVSSCFMRSGGLRLWEEFKVKFTYEDLETARDFQRCEGDSLLALIARLEAAERLVVHADKFCCESSLGLFLQDDLKAWRVTKGEL